MSKNIFITGFVFLFLISSLIGCDQTPKPPPPKATLVITWIVDSESPTTTQVPMSTMAACEKAKADVFKQGEQAKADRQHQNDKDKAEAKYNIQMQAERAKAQGGMLTGIGPEDERKLRGVPPPQVTAVCLQL